MREVVQLGAVTTHLAQHTHEPSELDRLLSAYSGPAIFVVWVASDSPLARDQLVYYYRQLRHVQPEVDGHYLKSLGLKPGPLFGRLLNAVRAARLDGKVTTRAEEETLVAQLLDEIS